MGYMCSLKVTDGALFRRSLQLGKVGERQLVSKCQRHASVLEHVVKGEVGDDIVGGMNVVIAVLKGRLDDKGGWVASLGGRGVVRACVAALSLDKRDATVLLTKFVSRGHP